MINLERGRKSIVRVQLYYSTSGPLPVSMPVKRAWVSLQAVQAAAKFTLVMYATRLTSGGGLGNCMPFSQKDLHSGSAWPGRSKFTAQNVDPDEVFGATGLWPSSSIPVHCSASMFVLFLYSLECNIILQINTILLYFP